ncbi:MAG: bacteriochlorophyll/chlorophyll synthetase [Proteobacteria bacterium SG_bin5]|nr:chlorophyll synthase ChlG [Sphingomonas sp.]OQW42994.1 MAG: bacteriochlorophyll/chlorophyll synthetase [Proteobacteria bacterium SG_bin5]
MARSTHSVSPSLPPLIAGPPRARDMLELLKPITWFPPIWAFLCGVVSAGVPLGAHLPFVLLGMILTGPAVCGTSQAINDWYDRHVDAINEPGRPIPSGRIPGRWGLWIALIGTATSLVLAAVIAAFAGPWVLPATALALLCAWAYSAPPARLKLSGIWGPGLVGFTYEGLSWFTGAAVIAGKLPPWPVLAVLLLYSLGAHGIMTLNDFKAIEGDRACGIRSLPATLGARRAAWVACAVMALPQLGVVLLLAALGKVPAALFVAALLAAQLALMPKLIADPVGRAPWYNATGTSLSVLGMLVAALGLAGGVRL